MASPLRRLTAAALLGACISTVFLAGPVVGATGNSGAIKVHDELSASPPQRNEPHVSCDFWIEGFKMSDDAGSLRFFSWPPTGDKTLVAEANWTGDPDSSGHGFHFLAGPFNLSQGHYRVEAFTDAGHPGDPSHFAKTKMFWIEACKTPAPAPGLACPTGLAAQPQPDGSVVLTFTPAPGADGTNLYRAVGDANFSYVATLGPNVTSYHDANTSAPLAYAYTVTGLFGTRESTGCPIGDVATVPDFPTSLGLAAASVGGLAVYALARRRHP